MALNKDLDKIKTKITGAQMNENEVPEVEQEVRLNRQLHFEMRNREEAERRAFEGVEILDKEEIVKAAVEGRTISAILTETVNASDSKEMADVKNTIRTCNEIRSKELSAETLEEIQTQIRDMELSYLDAIAACQYYCDHKNPKFVNGKVRKKAVSDTLELLKTEMQWIPKLREMVNREGLPEAAGPVKLLDLLSEAGIRQKLEQEGETQEHGRKRNVQKDPVKRLTYEDFARMLTMDSEDRLEFRGQSLRVVKNGIWSKPANVTSEDNKRMAERFVAVAIQKIEQRQTLSEEQKANMKMRLQYQLGVKILDTQAGAISISRLRDTMDMVDHFVSDTDRAMQEDWHATPAEYRFASAVNESLAIPTREDVKSKAIYKKLNGILKDARKESIDIPSVSEEELQKIVAGKLYTVRDETFHNLQRMYQSMNCLNGGAPVDFQALASDQKTINCMIALSISRMTAATSAGTEAAEYKLRTYMEHKVFAHCGNAALEDDFLETRIFPLIHGGRTGLFRQVTEQISRTKQWKDKTKQVLSGMDHLGEVCSLLENLSDMQSRAFTKGLTQDEATRMQEIGAQLQALVTQENINDMELVARNLKGSRFAAGFTQLQELLKRKPNVFEDSTERIASAAKQTVEKPAVPEESPLAAAQEEARKQLGIEDDLQPVSLDETGELLAGLQEADREIAAVFLQEKKPSELIGESGDDTAKSIAALYFALRSMKQGDAFADVFAADVKFRLAKRKNGDVELRLDNKRICLPFSMEFLMYRLEQDISENPDKYGDELAVNVLQDTFLQARELETEDTSRAVFLNILNKKTGLDAAFFRNTPVKQLSRLAEDALRGRIDRAKTVESVNALTDPEQVMLNEADTLEMISVLEKQKKQRKNAVPTVVMAEKKQEANAKKEKNQWTPEEAEFVELLSDMVFSKDTWKTDLEKREPADRIRMLMYEHSELLAKMVKDKQFSDQFFQKLQLPGTETMIHAVKQQIDQLLESDFILGLSMLDLPTLTLLFQVMLGDEQDEKKAQPEINRIKKAVAARKTILHVMGMDAFMDSDIAEEEIPIEEMIQEQRANLLNGFRELDDTIDQQTKETVKEIQQQINASVDKLFDAKKGRKIIENMTLEELLEQNAKGQEGQGKFFKLVLTGYFEQACTMDQRAMIASALRDMKPAQTGEEQSEEEIDQQTGAFLGGFLKGAGPLLHKILQGLPMEGMPQSLKTAIGDVKSKLSPIAPEIVEARMNKLVMNSRGMITKIEVQRSLGAASIGQAFLCKIYGPKLEAEGKDVVIKLLRPDVQNHMEREKDFILGCAESTSEGMLKTYQGQLRAIEQELDLRIEAKNVELGKVYDRGVPTVQSMKLVNLVSPDINALMLERAPGSTVDTYLEEVRTKYQQLKTRHEETKDLDGGYRVMRELYELKADLTRRQDYVAELAKKWIVSGIYEEGFYHGDLHAGNIMVSEDKATVIDFGNAMQITKEQQISVLHMVCAALSQNIDGFRHHFHLLLSPESEATYQEKKEEFNEMLGIVLFKKGDVGMRIAVALAEAQKLGLELPAAIHNFSQCQIRLKNTVDDMAAQIQDMENEFRQMYNYCPDERTEDPFASIMNMVRGNIEARISYGEDQLLPLETQISQGFKASQKAIKEDLLTHEKDKQQEFEVMMKGWFEDLENHGAELQEKYNSILEKKQNGEALDERSKPVEKFVEVFGQALLQRAQQYEEMRRNRDQIKPKNFYAAMEDVVMERFDQSVKCLGLVGLYRYQLKNNTKPKPGKKALERQQRKEEAETLIGHITPTLPKLQLAQGMILVELDRGVEADMRQANEERLRNLMGEQLPTQLENAPLSKADRERLNAEFAEYRNTHRKEQIYHIAQILFELYQECQTYTAYGSAQEVEWEALMHDLPRAIAEAGRLE